MRQPMLDMGGLAATLVLDAIKAPKPRLCKANLLHMLQPVLVERDSTRQLPGRKLGKKTT
jgi:DNA-binding LacI/PurR family transcriptional regulator